jgi:hypothetical protein
MAAKVIPKSSGDLGEIQKEIDILRKCHNTNIVTYFGTCSVDELWVDLF